MIPRILTVVVAVASVLLVSCSPYPEHRPNQPQAGPKPTPAQAAQAEQAKREAQQEEARLRADEEKRMQAQAEPRNPEPNREIIDPAPEPGGKKSDPFKPGEYEFAKKAPGREGFVLSPYNNKIIDVRDEKTGKQFPRGTLVSDPTYPASEKKYFRVP